MADTKGVPPPPSGSTADWFQIDTNHAVLIRQQFLQMEVGFAVGSKISTTSFVTTSQDGFVIATLMKATRPENVKACFACPAQVDGEYGLTVTVTLEQPAQAGEQVIVCLYQPAMKI